MIGRERKTVFDYIVALVNGENFNVDAVRLITQRTARHRCCPCTQLRTTVSSSGLWVQWL